MKKLLLLPLLLILSLASQAQTNTIMGYINYDSTTLTSPDTFKVWLVSYSTGTTTLAAVDSQIGTGWGHVLFMFNNEPAGNYLVKANRLNQVVGTAGLLPTYHDSSLYWSSAQTILYSGTGSTVANIWMKTGTVLSGPGFVGGNVSLGANKGVGSGVTGVLIFLRDAGNNVVSSTYTDANGDYSFSNIPDGTYNVYPEAINYATTPANSLVVGSGSTQVTGINFHQDNNQKNIKPFGLAIAMQPGIDKFFKLYPNPASKTVSIFWNITSTAAAHILITNTTGQVVLDKFINNASNSSAVINISTLSSGIYFLHGTAALNGMMQRLVVE